MARKSNNFFGNYLNQSNGYGNDMVTPTNTFAKSLAGGQSTGGTGTQQSKTNTSGYSVSPSYNAKSSTYTGGTGYGSGSGYGGGNAGGASYTGSGGNSGYSGTGGSYTSQGSGINALPKIHPGDTLSLGDIVNYSGNLGNQYFQQFNPLQGMTADIYKAVLSGDISSPAIQALIAPRLAQVATAIPQAQEQERNTMQGGALQEALGNTAQMGVSERAKAIQDILGPLMSGAMERGSNSIQTILQTLLGPAAIREFQKQMSASQSSGGLFGGLF